jgi:hypothetical protein
MPHGFCGVGGGEEGGLAAFLVGVEAADRLFEGGDLLAGVAIIAASRTWFCCRLGLGVRSWLPPAICHLVVVDLLFDGGKVLRIAAE